MKVDLSLVTNYSEAFFSAAVHAGAEKLIADQAAELSELVKSQPKLIALMEAPNIHRDTKEEIFAKVFGGRFHPLMLQYVSLLLRRGRLELFFPTLKAVQERYQKHIGHRAATVESAVELSAAEKQRLSVVLGRLTGFELEIKWMTDPALIGGIRFRCGDTLIDRTLAYGLRRLTGELMKAQVI